MTREEMIRKVLEIASPMSREDIGDGFVYCYFCEEKGFDETGVEHSDDCPYEALTEPVFDVGDTVMFKESKFGIVEGYSVEADESLIRLEDGTFWTSNKNLTLVRKGEGK